MQDTVRLWGSDLFPEKLRPPAVSGGSLLKNSALGRDGLPILDSLFKFELTCVYLKSKRCLSIYEFRWFPGSHLSVKEGVALSCAPQAEDSTGRHSTLSRRPGEVGGSGLPLGKCCVDAVC